MHDINKRCYSSPYIVSEFLILIMLASVLITVTIPLSKVNTGARPLDLLSEGSSRLFRGHDRKDGLESLRSLVSIGKTAIHKPYGLSRGI